MKTLSAAVVVGAGLFFAPVTSIKTPSGVTLVRVPSGGIQPEAAIDPRGVLHLVYFSGEARAGDLFYVRSTDYG